VIDIDIPATACRWYDRRLAEVPVVTDAQRPTGTPSTTAAAQGVDLVVTDNSGTF
jgi:hypothetical protein